MKGWIAGVIVCAGLAGCAAQPPLLQNTASGWPETTFDNTSLATVKQRLSTICSNWGSWVIQSADDSQIVCKNVVQNTNGLTANVLFGHQVIEVQHIRFVMIGQTSGVRVIAYMTDTSTDYNGQLETVQMNDNKTRNTLQYILSTISNKPIDK